MIAGPLPLADVVVHPGGDGAKAEGRLAQAWADPEVVEPQAPVGGAEVERAIAPP